MTKKYNVILNPEVYSDIFNAVSFYKSQSKELGKRFYSVVNSELALLKTQPHFQIRYSKIHCMPVKGFPFLIHYSIIEESNLVVVHGVIHTSLNPKKNWKE